MARTFLRQAEQIRKSDLFVDNVAPAAAMESAAVTLEDDLNNLRSIASLLRDVQTGNWYDDLAAPVTFEGGIKRGVQNLNQELHDLERKRVLVQVYNINDVPVGTLATGTLTATGNFANGETVNAGGKTYVFQTVLTNVDGNVLIGATASDSLDNLIAAINLGAGSGTLYAAATTANTFVSALAGAGDTMVVSAKIGGLAGNAYVTTDTAVNASWGSATLTGGANSAVAILTLASQLPANTIAAIGAVTTRGTVAAAHGGTFGQHSLTAVGGATVTILLAPIDQSLLDAATGLTAPANEAIGGRAAIWAIAMNSVGTALLIAGALVSIARRRRVGPNTAILLGVIVIALAGTLTRLGGQELLYAGQMLGLLILGGGMEWAARGAYTPRKSPTVAA
jgi:hypothetical protein